RQKHSRGEQTRRFHCVVGTEVHVTPRRVERTDLEHDDIERSKALANRCVFAGESRIAAEEHRMPWRADDERRPQRGVAALWWATREVRRRSGADGQPGPRQVVRFPPVELDDALRRHAPRLEVCTDSQGRDEGYRLPAQLPYRRIVEMIIVIVR